MQDSQHSQLDEQVAGELKRLITKLRIRIGSLTVPNTNSSSSEPLTSEQRSYLGKKKHEVSLNIGPLQIPMTFSNLLNRLMPILTQKLVLRLFSSDPSDPAKPQI